MVHRQLPMNLTRAPGERTSTMIRLEDNGVVFNYRVVGVAFDGDRVLLHRVESDPFWALPGGRVELLEPSIDGLKREMQEELGVDVYPERLVWFVENFFEYLGKQFHEVALYFKMSFAPNCPLYGLTDPFVGDEGGLRLIYQWFPLNELAGLPLYPTFLAEALQTLPNYPVHIVHTDPAIGT